MKDNFIKKQQGFTLIEVMVSVTIFVVVMLVGVGSLIDVNKAHKATQNARSLIDTLNFAMEDMSRNLRLGYDYYCGDISSYTADTSKNPKNDCPDDASSSIIFEPMNGKFPDGLSSPNTNNQVVYFIEEDNNQKLTLKKMTGLGSNSEVSEMISPDIELDDTSGFRVFGWMTQTINNQE